MLSPYDWQEGIGHRTQYVESRLATGSPVVGASFKDGIVFLTYRRQARKVYEVYDELMMGAIGQQSDIEAMRQAAVDFAHQEGFNRSERDVTVKRVVHALSGPIKKAFADFSMVPVVARAIFAQVGPSPDEDAFVMLDFDGDFHSRHCYGYVAPTQEAAEILDEKLRVLKGEKLTCRQGLEQLRDIWLSGLHTEELASPKEATAELSLEFGQLDRFPKGENRFYYSTEYEE
jgi:proteasome alpha subunit